MGDNGGTTNEASAEAQAVADEGQKDELGLLITAWLFDPEISSLFEAGDFNAALEKAGIGGRADLVAKLQGIDPEQIKELVKRFRRPLVRPMS